MKQFLILISGFLIACTSQQDPVKEVHLSTTAELQAMAIEESLIPVHSGVPGEVPFWNAYAQRFIYAPAFDFDIVDGADAYRGEDLSDRQMLIYPSSTALAYLDLYNATSDKKYFDAAIRIADTYKKLQLGNGSWYLLLYIESGDPVTGNYVVPMGIKNFMERLKDEYGITGYEECTRRALRYVEDNLVKEFTWEGQFEDQKPSEKYKNLSKGQACSYALHLLKIAEGDEQVISEAEELIRFAEDQFVIWGEPNPILLTHGVPKGTDSWLTPCVLEQYNFYTPVNASSANLIEAFRTAYDQTGNILYLAKAMDLANTIVRVQKTNGHYPTYLDKNRLEHEGWINCMVFTAMAVNELDEYLNKISPESELFLPMN